MFGFDVAQERALSSRSRIDDRASCVRAWPWSNCPRADHLAECNGIQALGVFIPSSQCAFSCMSCAAPCTEAPRMRTRTRIVARARRGPLSCQRGWHGVRIAPHRIIVRMGETACGRSEKRCSHCAQNSTAKQACNWFSCQPHDMREDQAPVHSGQRHALGAAQTPPPPCPPFPGGVRCVAQAKPLGRGQAHKRCLGHRMPPSLVTLRWPL